MEIELTQGKVVTVDAEDFEKLFKFTWQFNGNGGCSYAMVRKIKGRSMLMHRFLMGLKEGDPRHVDHINGNGLDNRKKNLRICTKAENMRNSKLPKDNKSGYKGVHWVKKLNKWRSTIRMNNKIIYIGLFDSSLKGAKAYDEKCLELHGEFAKTNKMMGLL